MRVLIVDDDETFCQFLRELLEAQGFDVDCSTDGFVGYEMSLSNSYDLMIVDYRMPLVLGTELAGDLKEDNPGARVILISAFSDATIVESARRLGVPLLSKPFSPQRLLDVIGETLGPRT